MAKWLNPPSSGKIYRNSAGRVYTGVAGVPVFFEDADVSGALSDGWTYSPTATLEPEGKQIPVPAAYAIDSSGNVTGLVGPSGAVWQDGLSVPVLAGGALDTALNTAIAALRVIAAANGGRAPVCYIPGGSYTWSSTSSTVTLEPWMRFKTTGSVQVSVTGLTVPAFWLRNDPPAGQINQGSTVDFANAKVIDGSAGVLEFVGNLSVGGALIRYGNGDGSWGTAYAGSATFPTALGTFESLSGVSLDNGIQFTNNNSFKGVFNNIRLNGCNKNIVTSAGAFANSGEQHLFHNCFFHNTNTGHIQFNGPGADTNGHQLTFVGGSLTFCAGYVIDFTVANAWVAEFIGSRMENFTVITQSSNSTAAPQGTLRLTGMTIIPTTGGGTPTPPYLRKMFTGTHVLQVSNLRFAMTNLNYWQSGNVYGQADKQFLCDSTVQVQHLNVYASEPLGLFSANANIRSQPIFSLDDALNYNADMELAIANSGSTGTATLDGKTWTANVNTFGQTTPTSNVTVITGANNFFTGSQGIKVDQSAATYGNICSGLIAVRAGRNYFGDLVARCASGASANLVIIPQVVWYASDGTTQVGTTQSYNQNVNYQNWFNVISATQFYRHPTGTGIVRAPAGAAFARVIWNFCASTGVVSTSLVAPTNAIWYVDSAPFVEL